MFSTSPLLEAMMPKLSNRETMTTTETSNALSEANLGVGILGGNKSIVGLDALGKVGKFLFIKKKSQPII